MWYLLQCLIIFAVIASNIAWQWTPNIYIPSLLGVGLAYGLTKLIAHARVSKDESA